jgi:Zn-dependent protease/CBS domain-containing protein
MFGKRITLFKLVGFEVRLDASWIVIAALVTWSLATAVFPSSDPGLPARSYWWMGFVGALAFFGSIILHEFCHSVVARHYQLPMKGITLFIFGGVAEMSREPETPGVEFLMAIAGPAASIALGGLFYIVQALARSSAPEVVGVIAYLAWINWILAGFNLIAAFPLDGGRMLRAALWRWKGDLTRATQTASSVGSGFGFVLMAFAIYQLFFGNLISAIWYFLIGSFLRGAAQMSYEQVLLRSALAGEPVRRFMRPDPVTVHPGMSIRQLIEDYLYRYDFKVYPVVDAAQEVIGCITTGDIKSIPKNEWDQRRVSDVLKPCSESNTVGPETDALNALSKIQETGSSGLLVTKRNHLLAIISPRDVLNFLTAKMKLEGRSPGGLLAH